MAADDVALEHLDALAVTFRNAIVHLYVVSHVKLGDVIFELLLLDGANDIHGFSILLSLHQRIRCLLKDAIG